MEGKAGKRNSTSLSPAYPSAGQSLETKTESGSSFRGTQICQESIRFFLIKACGRNRGDTSSWQERIRKPRKDFTNESISIYANIKKEDEFLPFAADQMRQVYRIQACDEAYDRKKHPEGGGGWALFHPPIGEDAAKTGERWFLFVQTNRKKDHHDHQTIRQSDQNHDEDSFQSPKKS